LQNTEPRVDFKPITGAPSPLTLDNLDRLNALGGTKVHLTSKVDITKSPAYLKGVSPDSSGRTNGAVTAAIVVNDKGGGEVDAFYFYFYA
jgi:hypothetical protein